MSRHPALAVCVLVSACSAASLAAQGRPDVQGTRAAVVADHPLAAAAGADVLRRGGNAVDAAITMAAVLAVVRPHMNGVGGDAFMLIREGRSGRVHALNGSGRAGTGATPAAFRARGHERVPARGRAVRHGAGCAAGVGRCAAAIRQHRTGRTASSPQSDSPPMVSPSRNALRRHRRGPRRIAADPGAAAVFLPDGRAPAPGTLLVQPDLARTLQVMARDGVDVFYNGEIAARIHHFMSEEGGLVTGADLVAHSSTWQQPIATTYQGYRVLAFPPNTQGVALLMQMNMASLFDQARARTQLARVRAHAGRDQETRFR
jgi:gamma-glutamyltranspeptidase